MQKSKLVKSSSYAWVVMILLIFMQFIYAGLTLSTVTLYMEPILAAHPNISRTAYALTITLNGGANAIVSVFYGQLVEKFGLKKMIAFCAILMLLGVFLYAKGTALWMFYLAAILEGISLCFCSGASCSIIFSKWFAHSTGTLLSATAIGSGLAGVIFSPIVANWIANPAIGWNGALMINLAIVAVTAVVLIAFLKDSPEPYGVQPMWNDKVKIASESGEIIPYGVTAKEAFKTAQFWCGTLGIGLIALIVYGTICNIAIYSSDLGFNGGVMLSVMYAANIVLQLPFGILADKLGIRVCMVAYSIMAIIAVFIYATAPAIGMFYVATIFVGGAFCILKATLPVYTLQVFGNKDQGKIMGYMIAVMNCGVAFGMPILNAAYDVTGSYSGMFKLFGYAAIVLTIMLFVGCKPIAKVVAEKKAIENSK
ncbi:MAG: MFS transporter [Oscillospiraceae bacterium]|nr:MFS transporter [Oscillospiraceae bacterium]